MAGLSVLQGTVKGRFLSAEQVPDGDADIDGVPMRGTVTFTPNAPRLVHAASDVVIVGKPIRVSLDELGAFTTKLVATDDPGLSPTGWTYAVMVAFEGSPQMTFSMNVPAAGVMDLSDVIPLGTPPNPGVLVPRQDGTPGPSGKSAYELAVLSGYVGTLAEWLDFLKGAPGAPGPAGPQGAQGAQGATGAPGALGPKGDKGDVGSAGPAGTQGAPGPTGSVGPVGPKGDVGAAGSTGPAGVDAPHFTNLSAPTGKWASVTIEDDNSATANWVNRLEFLFKPFGGTARLVSWFNEYGELRLIPGKSNTVPFRIFSKTQAADPNPTANMIEIQNNRADRVNIFTVGPDGTVTAPNVGARVEVIANGAATPLGLPAGTVIVELL